MRGNCTNTSPNVVSQIEDAIQRTTHGRIRDLVIEETPERYVVRGCAPSYYTKQLALSGAMQLLPGDRFEMNIRVS